MNIDKLYSIRDGAKQMVAYIDDAIAEADAKAKPVGRGKIEAGAEVVTQGTPVGTLVVVSPVPDVTGRILCRDNKRRYILRHLNAHRLVKSAELRPGCTVRHKDGPEGSVFNSRVGKMSIMWERYGCSDIGTSCAGSTNPADLTIIRQPEGK